MSGEFEDDEPDSGPFCPHGLEPGDCDEPCKCGHPCGRHTYGQCSGEAAGGDSCLCEQFEDAGRTE